MMTVTVRVREDSGIFHGNLAEIAVEGDGSPDHFLTSMHAAMLQARKEQIASRMQLASQPMLERFVPQ